MGVGRKRDVDGFITRAARLHPALSDMTSSPGFADIFWESDPPSQDKRNIKS